MDHFFNKQVLDTLLSGILVFATIFLTRYTYLLVKEARISRRAMIQPAISIFLEQAETDVTLMSIIVQNIGTGPAYDLSFEIRIENVPAPYKLDSFLKVV